MLIKIDNINNDDIKIYKELREHAFRDDRSFIADSPKVVNLVLESELVIKSILATQEYYDEFDELLAKKNIAKKYVSTKEEMGKIVGHKIHHNCMMHGIRPKETPLEALGSKIIMLDNITSSENVGAIARSAAALGVNSYLLPKTSPHPFNRRALRVSMGHSAMLDVHIYDDIKKTIPQLQALGYKIFAAEVSENASYLSEINTPQKWVLLMGHEGKGIAKDILELCDEVVTIEMQEGIKSFNVAIAASIIMYQLSKSSLKSH
jgi:tRNA G18 (ribose-2'-O)-methylase SpoU